jgi:acetoin utilization deacetylase AcuC-like enzyme
LNLYYSPAYVGAGHSFDTTRKAGWIADSLAEAPEPGVTLVEPASLSWEDVERVHDPGYVEAVRTGEPRALAESQGFRWDPALGPMVLASNGGAVAAARDARRDGVAGSLSSGLHHARRDEGAGFCTFNGLVLAARAVLDDGASAVLVLDLDAHCGGGTASLIGDEPRIAQLDVAVDSYDAYRDGGACRLVRVARAADYLPAVERGLDEVLAAGPRPDLVLYNAGMDPSERCAIGGKPGITREVLAARERLVFDRCWRERLPVAFVAAGGYIGPALDVAGLVALHRLTVGAAAAIAGGSRS